ncbi:MAG TPA: MFS transporter [Xanthobacteraceae bacterium]|jgi:MFS family permease|nr:MFS transporter [Xanthobacteraceae bacterium]
MTAKSLTGWRTPAIILICGCIIALLTFGPRSAFGFFLTPMSSANGWGREVFALAFAIQNLLWGIGQPIAGAIADRFGTARVLCGGMLLYAAGLALMSVSTTPLLLDITSGVLIGFGLSGCSFNIVLSAFGKLLKPEWRGIALGLGTGAGSFGQFLFAPFGVAMIDSYGWQSALLVFGGLLFMAIPLALALTTPPATSHQESGKQQSMSAAFSEAFQHRSYVLLVLGFFTCGFQLAFVTAHLPSYLLDRGLDAHIGGWTIAIIGLFNIVGSLMSGYYGNFIPKRYILSFIYFTRALSIVAFIMLPTSVPLTLAFAVITGLTWLSTVPPTSGLVAVMFGTRWLAMLYGFAFFSHQVGGFLGVWLGGIVFEATGSYNPVWWLSVFFGVASALINLPIVEKPAGRFAAASI